MLLNLNNQQHLKMHLFILVGVRLKVIKEELVMHLGTTLWDWIG